MTERNVPVWIIAAAAGLLCLLVYLRALSCGFVNYDDPLYVFENPLIRQLNPEMLRRALSESHAGYWMPLTWISLAIDYHFWGLNPLGYHLTNILLHAVNTGLVVLIADSVLKVTGTRGRAAGGGVSGGYLYPAAVLLAGLLWGIHPLRVESVAWVTERKDVLNGLFVFSSVLVYLHYAETRRAALRSWPAYVLSLLLFAGSLMAKPVTVVLPVMLLVLDRYPLDRLRRGELAPRLLEKTPFFLLSAVVAVMTVRHMSANIFTYETFPMTERVLVSGHAVFEYCRLMLFPVGILPQYPLPHPLPSLFMATTATVAVLFCAGMFAGISRPWGGAVMLLFLLPLLPTLSFFPAGDQVMAARFTYLPSVPVSIMAAAAFSAAASRISGVAKRRTVWTCAVALLLCYAGMSWKLIGIWRDTGTYWSRMIELKPLGRAYSDRGRFYLETGRYAEAADDLGRAAEIATQVGMPEAFNLYAIRGEALAKMGRHRDAVQEFTKAIAIYPAPAYFYYRGQSLMALDRKAEAGEDLRRGGPDPGPIRWYTPQ